MKSLKTILAIFVSSTFLLGFLSPISKNSRLDSIESSLNQNLEHFAKSIESYKQNLEAFESNEINKSSLIDAHLNCRSSFKAVETYLFYFQGEAIKKYINGAPLPSIEKNTSSLFVFEPKGLQTLDELIVEDILDIDLIHNVLDETEREFLKIKKYQKTIKLYDYQVIEANRASLIRIFTQGVTGFDTPGSLYGINESYVVLENMYKDISHYRDLVRPALFTKVTEAFEKGLTQLEKEGFEEFDRLSFLIECINPLYAALLDIQIELGIELPNEILQKRTAVNYMAKNIFSADFLDEAYYAQLEIGGDKNARRELGEFLFFDPVLSKNMKGSCASCHIPEKGFSDGQQKSLAFDGSGTIERNAPGLINAVLADRYFHDLRASELKFQLDHVVFSDKEFNTNYIEIVERLRKSETYKDLFQKAFSNRKHSLSSETVKLAINEYVASLVGFNSPFDQYVQGYRTQIDPRVRNGFNLFTGKANCATCHFSPTFNGNVPPDFEESESEVLGVPSDKSYSSLDNDLGRFANRRDKEKVDHYKYSFKTPTVRNVELTAPYMHNGVFSTLEELMEFYNKGGGEGHGLNVPGQTLGADPLDLSDKEIEDIILFMEHLTEESINQTWPDSLPSFERAVEWNNRYTKLNY